MNSSRKYLIRGLQLSYRPLFASKAPSASQSLLSQSLASNKMLSRNYSQDSKKESNSTSPYNTLLELLSKNSSKGKPQMNFENLKKSELLSMLVSVPINFVVGAMLKEMQAYNSAINCLKECYTNTELDGYISYGIAECYASLGETSKALEGLKLAHQSYTWREVAENPVFEKMREDPRFIELVKSIRNQAEEQETYEKQKIKKTEEYIKKYYE